jgi:hypothetical protein
MIYGAREVIRAKRVGVEVAAPTRWGFCARLAVKDVEGLGRTSRRCFARVAESLKPGKKVAYRFRRESEGMEQAACNGLRLGGPERV